MPDRNGNHYKHGYSTHANRHPLYAVWNMMKQRCYNNNNSLYKNWGGRGITICDSWRYGPKSFIDWAINNGWKKGLLIDRIDNNGPYYPENCRFVSPKVSSNNRRPRLGISGIPGISWESDRSCWTIRIQNKRHGRFRHLSDARRKFESLISLSDVARGE